MNWIDCTAQDLVDKHGENLLNRHVWTYPYGAWPGGPAVVTEIAPDANAPEIVFTIRGYGERVERAIRDQDLDDAEMGVFDHEQVRLLEVSVPVQRRLIRLRPKQQNNN